MNITRESSDDFAQPSFYVCSGYGCRELSGIVIELAAGSGLCPIQQLAAGHGRCSQAASRGRAGRNSRPESTEPCGGVAICAGCTRRNVRRRYALAGGQASEAELEFWRSIKDSNKTEELNAYLTNYPNGTFKSIALARIASLQDGPSTTTRALSTGVGVDPATFSEEASQLTEDQLSLDRNQRRDVQRRLTGLGFDIKASGKFDANTRAVITRWQAARGYPKSGYLNALQHKALQSEILATKVASTDDDEPAARPSRRRSSGGGGRHYHRSAGGGGPGGLFGGMMRPLFGR